MSHYPRYHQRNYIKPEEMSVEIPVNHTTANITDTNPIPEKYRHRTLINDKYIFITQGENNLIASVRKEDDKRFYEYFIVSTEVKAAQKLIEKN